MTTTVAGVILFVLGLLITVVAIVVRPPRQDVLTLEKNGVWEKIVDAIIRWIDGVINGRSPKKQLTAIGILVMIAGVFVIVGPAVWGTDDNASDTPSDTPSQTPSPSMSPS